MTTVPEVSGCSVTAIELLETAPDDQEIRCRMVISAICEGEWEEAYTVLKRAAKESTDREWSRHALTLAQYCRSMAGLPNISDLPPVV
jgi:hypothetical protein